MRLNLCACCRGVVTITMHTLQLYLSKRYGSVSMATQLLPRIQGRGEKAVEMII